MNQTHSGIPDIGELFLVGDLHVDVSQQRITRATPEAPLPNLSFQLLLALIRVAPNVLSNSATATHLLLLLILLHRILKLAAGE
jgi:DNA-binding response OmpR family regulator